MAPTKISTRRLRAPRQEQEEIPNSIFDALNLNPPGGVQRQEEPERKVPKGPTVEELQKQLADLTSRMEHADRANMALTTAQPVLKVEPKEPQFSLENMPDIVADDGKSYAAELAKRTAQYTKDLQDFHQAKQTASAPAPGQNPSELWNEFSQSYADYAADQEGIEFATQKVVAQAQRKGLDVNRYMFQNSDRFFRDVVKVYDERFGKPEAEEEVEPTPRRRAKRQEEPEDEGRTGGIFGGIDHSSGKGTPSAPPPGDMVKDLQDIQRKMGYY